MARVGPTSRNKSRSSQEVCADCGATDPGWASVNRGILICDGCCSVHRSLGRHISHVKSLKKGTWHPAQLAMVHSLNNSGANHIWEHTRLDPSTVKSMRPKPQPKDPVHPNKADFIRAKHQMMSFVYRPNRDENSGAEKDVSRQLHASVRTGNLETSLRLLSLGADPNYYHAEKGNCPLHVAARAGQVSQVELLVIYGADPGAPDNEGQTPVDYARDGNYLEIADRLVEFQYELTDHLAYYLCGRKPEHTSGYHWIIPEMADALDSSDVSKEARSKLIALPNHSFEELACDVYDEIDRRETDSIWLSLQNQSALLSDRCSVPFLPVNPEFSSTRNQGRQKLARFNAREFATLIIDILIEARRRMAGSTLPSYMPVKDKDNSDMTMTQVNFSSHQHLTNSNIVNDRVNTYRQTCPSMPAQHGSPSLTTFSSTQSQSSLSCNTGHAPLNLVNITSNSQMTKRLTDGVNDDEPLYDSVASEDDYSSWERKRKLHNQQEILNLQSQARNNLQDSDYQDLMGSPERSQNCKTGTAVSASVSLDQYLEMKRHLMISETRIKELQDDNIVMSAKLNELSTMVHTLKEENDCLRSQGSSPSLLKQDQASHYQAPFSLGTSQSLRSYSPFYEGFNHPLHNGDSTNVNSRLSETGTGSPSSATSLRHQRPYSMFESRGKVHQHHNFSATSDGLPPAYPSYDDSPVKSIEITNESTSQLSDLPSQEEVVRKTEMITKRIQDLLLSAQDSQHDRFVPCSEQINVAVKEMADLFPKTECPHEMWNAVQQLLMSASRLQMECRNHISSQMHILDPGRVTQQVIQCAYDIAKAAKVLVTHFQ